MYPYVIPANYTEAGRLLGLFEIRNTIEAVAVAVPILLFSFGLLPFAVTTKCIIALFLAVPPGGFALPLVRRRAGMPADTFHRGILSRGRICAATRRSEE